VGAMGVWCGVGGGLSPRDRAPLRTSLLAAATHRPAWSRRGVRRRLGCLGLATAILRCDLPSCSLHRSAAALNDCVRRAEPATATPKPAAQAGDRFQRAELKPLCPSYRAARSFSGRGRVNTGRPLKKAKGAGTGHRGGWAFGASGAAISRRLPVSPGPFGVMRRRHC